MALSVPFKQYPALPSAQGGLLIARNFSEVERRLNQTTPSGGFISLWFGTAANVPTGWAICDGTNGTPDMRGRVPVGVDTTQVEFDTLGEAGGAKTHTLTSAEMPVHTHVQNAHTHVQDIHSHQIQRNANQANAGGGGGVFGLQLNSGAPFSDTQGTTATNQNSTPTNQNAGSGSAHNNLQPYRALHFIMWLG